MIMQKNVIGKLKVNDNVKVQEQFGDRINFYLLWELG